MATEQSTPDNSLTLDYQIQLAFGISKDVFLRQCEYHVSPLTSLIKCSVFPLFLFARSFDGSHRDSLVGRTIWGRSDSLVRHECAPPRFSRALWTQHAHSRNWNFSALTVQERLTSHDQGCQCAIWRLVRWSRLASETGDGIDWVDGNNGRTFIGRMVVVVVDCAFSTTKTQLASIWRRRQ